MMMGKRDRSAMITAGWGKIVEEYMLKEGEIASSTSSMIVTCNLEKKGIRKLGFDSTSSHLKDEQPHWKCDGGDCYAYMLLAGMDVKYQDLMPLL